MKVPTMREFARAVQGPYVDMGAGNMKVPTMRELEAMGDAVENLGISVWRSRDATEAVVWVSWYDSDIDRVRDVRFFYRHNHRRSYRRARFLAGRHIDALKEAGL